MNSRSEFRNDFSKYDNAKIPTFPGYDISNKEKIKKLFDDYASEAAKSLNLSYKDYITNSQLRLFYQEVKRIERKYKGKWNNIYIQILMLKAKLNYQLGRKENSKKNSYKNFSLILTDLLSNLNEQNFDTFCLLFEAIVGYYNYFRPEQ